MKTASDLRIPFAWKDRHPVLLERCLYIPNFYADHAKWIPSSWSDREFFGNEAPVVIEYCSGNGQWICNRAKTMPHINFVAVEKRFDRARKIWACLQREAIPNLFVVCGEAVIFSKHYVPPISISEVFINFPDPWPKLRHAKHRLVAPPFIAALDKVLKRGGKATFTTDDRPYLDLMLEILLLEKGWKPLLEKPYFATNWADFGSSYFCDLWQKKGRTIYHLPFEVSR